MKKTIEQWINLFESPYREEALVNISQKNRNKEVEIIHLALYNAFSWASTPQGSGYWNDYYNRLRINPPIEVIYEIY